MRRASAPSRDRFVLTLLVVSLLAAVATGCVETVRCPDGEFFGDGGGCVQIPDAGPPDAGASDGG